MDQLFQQTQRVFTHVLILIAVGAVAYVVTFLGTAKILRDNTSLPKRSRAAYAKMAGGLLMGLVFIIGLKFIQ